LLGGATKTSGYGNPNEQHERSARNCHGVEPSAGTNSSIASRDVRGAQTGWRAVARDPRPKDEREMGAG
jgi:hypothetical protein